jgi:RNA polymerase-binding transcription factor DksA
MAIKKLAPKKTGNASKKSVKAAPASKKAAPKKTVKPVVKKAAVKKAAPKKAVKPVVKKAAPKKVASKTPVKASKPVAKKAAPKKNAAKAPKKAVKPVVKKAAAKKVTPKKAAPKKAVKPVVKKAAPKKAAAKAPAKVNKTVTKKEAPKKPVKVVKAVKEVKVKVAAKEIVKPVVKKEAVKKEPKKSVKVVVPKTSTSKTVEYKPEFTKSVLDKSAGNENIGPTMRYSDKELVEFKELIYKKLDAAKKELSYLQGLITRKDGSGDMEEGRYMTMEDGGISMERENLSQMASRQIQFIDHLEKAMMRIENKSYGICRVTGKLIDKARLRAVPHATLSIEAKQMMNK